MGAHGPVEVAKTILEVADVAWTAVECCHHHHHHHHHDHDDVSDENHADSPNKDMDLESLKAENRRLRDILEQNLKLLYALSASPSFSDDCPPDLYARLMATIHSKDFLAQLKSLHGAETKLEFPFKEATGADRFSAETLINIDHEEPSWWVWVTDDMVPDNIEEWSGIDDENYVVIGEEHVVDGVATFMAKCILSNPKAKTLPPEEMQKTLAKALGGVNKFEKMMNIWHAGKLFYALSTWGLALAGLYRGRAMLRLAALGVHTTSKVVLRAL